MKKKIIFSALVISLIIQSVTLMAGNPHGHKQYLKHNKHHKAHKVHHLHGLIDATYN